MKQKLLTASVLLSLVLSLVTIELPAQIGKRFPSEKKVIRDPVTGIMLSFLTSTQTGDSKSIKRIHNGQPMASGSSFAQTMQKMKP